ncbi:comF family protein [Allochromatium warmingii]|uniref:ComF family protein n=1 Tax=Allochromatium warmingii TaxID=61595 RepID=A0A1H3ISN5_ALLWA|nr:ComF family protein [Allochromatium warmingii]SDY30567.1 comF family protein [Allochromatium warmingii]
MRSLLDSLLDRIFPPTCLLCGAAGAAGRDLCDGCALELPYNLRACWRCGRPFLVPLPDGAICGDCERSPPPFAACFSVFRYTDAIPFLITGAKFRGQLNAARLLGQCLAEHISATTDRLPDALVPVPLHRQRQRTRGYNQALEIARVAGRALALPLESRWVTRPLATAPQSSLTARARRRNIQGAFAAQTELTGQSIAIVDDVMTTNSTVSELTRVLLDAGAGQVVIWAVARTL